MVGNFTGGQAPHARIANASAASWWVAGNTIFVGDNHAESQATALTINPTLSQGTIGKIICHNHSGSYPPASADLRATATVSTTAAVALNLTATIGSLYVYGLTFAIGFGASVTALMTIGNANSSHYYDNCVFKIATTIAGQFMDILGAAGGGAIVWNNCQVSFAATGQFIHINHGFFTWQNTGQVLASGSSVPTALINQHVAGYACSVTLEALDLSQVTTVFGIAFTEVGNWIVKDCKLSASALFSTPLGSGLTVQYVRTDGGATAYKSTRYNYEGSETTETSITRVGGAADPTGQAQSRKIFTTANSQWVRPFKAEPYAVWNPTTGGNVTGKVYGVSNGSARPRNDGIWMDVEYLGWASFPIGTVVNTTVANLLSADAAVASDASTWNNTTNTVFEDSTISVGSVALSNGNLTVTHVTTAANAGVRSINPQSAGKYYFEVTVGAVHGTFDCAGIMDPTVAYSVVAVNAGSSCCTFQFTSGNASANNASVSSGLGAFAANDILGFAVDLTARKFWLRKNGGNWLNQVIGSQNPATGTGGLTVGAGVTSFVPMVGWGSSGTAGDNMTANFGNTAYNAAAPSGFGNWSGSFTPFKLVATLSSPQPGMAGYLEARVRVGNPSTAYFIDPKPVLS